MTSFIFRHIHSISKPAVLLPQTLLSMTSKYSKKHRFYLNSLTNIKSAVRICYQTDPCHFAHHKLVLLTVANLTIVYKNFLNSLVAMKT